MSSQTTRTDRFALALLLALAGAVFGCVAYMYNILLIGEGTLIDYRSAAWSTDGNEVAMVACARYLEDDVGDCQAIYVESFSDRTLETITNKPGHFNYAPTWSPDGLELAYVSDNEGSHAIYVWSENGATTRLTSTSSWSSMPAWSPDGSQIAFSFKQDDDCCQIQIAVTASDGGGKITPLTNSEHADLLPGWSPSGKSIAFIRIDRIWYVELLPFLDSPVIQSVRVISSSGEEITEVAINETAYFYGSSNLTWSPDGSKIAFSAKPNDSTYAVYIIDVSQAGYYRYDVDIRPSNLVWSPDSKRIAFSNTSGLFVMQADNGSTRLLSASQGLAPFWTSDQSLSYFEIAVERMVLENNYWPLDTTPRGHREAVIFLP